ncbi:MAG: hypothetical protein RIS79_3349, partial [Verrucomicrobiota bacterium]
MKAQAWRLRAWRLLFLDGKGSKVQHDPSARQSTTMISSTQLDGTTVCRHLPGAADREAFVTYSG